MTVGAEPEVFEKIGKKVSHLARCTCVTVG